MPENFKKCCFTGYRPSKFPFALDDGNSQFKRFENKLIDAVFSLADEGCYTFYSGMAMGFDIIAARTVLMLRDSYKKASISLVCVIPFIEQPKTYDNKWRDEYNYILSAADETVLISDKYFKGCYQRRNIFMVDNSDYILTWYNGLPGGTKNTLDYAKNQNKKIVNLFENGVHEYYGEGGYEFIEV